MSPIGGRRVSAVAKPIALLAIPKLANGSRSDWFSSASQNAIIAVLLRRRRCSRIKVLSREPENDMLNISTLIIRDTTQAVDLMSKKSAMSSREGETLKVLSGDPSKDIPGTTETATSHPIPAPASQPLSIRSPHHFEFIYDKDGASRKKARAHVMRDFMRKKRQKEIDNYRSSRSWSWSTGSTSAEPSGQLSAGPGQFLPGQQVASLVKLPKALIDRLASRLPSIASAARDDQQKATSTDVLPDNSSPWPSFTTADLRWLGASSQPYTSNDVRYGNPLNSLSTTPGDPFASLTLPLSPQSPEQGLVHHCINTLALALFIKPPLDFNPLGSLIHLWGQYEDSLGFQAMLAWTATQISGLQGQTETPLSLDLKTRLIRRVNEALGAAVTPTSPIILFSIVILTVIEERSGALSATATHFSAVRFLLRNIGGLRGLPAIASPALCKHVFITLITAEIFQQHIPATDWGLSWDGTEFSRLMKSYFEFQLTTDLPPWHQEPTAIADTLSTDEADKEAADQLLCFLRSCSTFKESAQQYHSIQPRVLTELPGHTPTQYPSTSTHLFRPGSLLHALLSSSPEHPVEQFGFIEARSHVPTFTQLSLLIYFNVTIWNYRCEPDKLNAWLEWLQHTISANYQTWAPSVQGLLLTLAWQERNSPQEDVERAHAWWFSTRLLRVCKRLRERLWEEVRMFLLSCLTLEEGVKSPSEEELWHDVVGGGYILQST